MADIGAQNAIVGDNFGTDLPQTEMPERDLVAERNAAKFSRTKEFQLLKEHLESRIGFYQNFLPDGRSMQLAGMSMDELGRQWLAANTIVGELKAIIMAYEQAQAAVDDASRA